MSEPVAVERAFAPYASNEEHLGDRFARADQLLKAETVRWRATLATTKPAEQWGMVLVGDREVSAYLETPYSPPGQLGPGLEQKLAPLWRRAEAIGSRIAARLAATPRTVDLRLERLALAFGLGGLERDLLALCLLVERDGRRRRLIGYLHDDATRRCPSVELLEDVLRPVADSADEVRSRLTAGPLIGERLLVIDGDDQPLADRSVRLDDRIAAFLTGCETGDPLLEGIASVADGPPLQRTTAAIPGLALAALGTRFGAASEQVGAVTLLVGPYGGGRTETARTLAGHTGRRLLVADLGRALDRALDRSGAPAPGYAGGWAESVDRVFREARLTGAAIAWRGCERLLERPEDAPRWDRLISGIERFPGPVFLISKSGWEPLGSLADRPFVRLDLPAPSYRERRRLWLAALPAAGPIAGYGDLAGRERLAEELANGFQLTAGQIGDAIASACGEAMKREPVAAAAASARLRLTAGDLLTGCRRQSGPLLTRFARRIEPRRELTFERLVLPSANRGQLADLRRRIHHRSRVTGDLGFEKRLTLGKGLVALFTGSSGTGKTLAAELLAGEQGVDLYKVDLSAVVSKYVGETEKNLDRVFAEAECSNALLFFDEADALFGKRGEVKEARDRWANLEINFLLQRIEEYPGVVILTTNLRQNIDEAFLRRIQVLVEFPFPDAEGRLAIWRGMFPDEIERPDDSILEPLAERFRLPGGSIKNVVLDAAVRALDDSETAKISLRHLALGLAREYQKLGKPVTRSEFGDDVYRYFEAELR